MKSIFLILGTSMSFACFGQASSGIFDNHQDIGSPKNAGAAAYDVVNFSYNRSAQD